jgi:hypothetical protein
MSNKFVLGDQLRMIAPAFQTSHRQFALIRIAIPNTHRERVPRRLLRLQTNEEDRPPTRTDRRMSLVKLSPDPRR